MRFKDIVAVEFEQDYYKKLHNYVENEYLHKTIFPPRQNIFRALNLCDYEDVKVVILGQDPYHVLTVEEGKANSHAGIGWEIFTLNIVKALNKREKPMVFILWGNNARSKKQYIDTSRHLVLESAHPSPLSAHRGFFGSKPFSKANDFLIKNNMTPIDWQIENV